MEKEELARAKERSSNYKASAEQNFKEARDGLNLVFSAETKREWGRDDLKRQNMRTKKFVDLKKTLTDLNQNLESKISR